MSPKERWLAVLKREKPDRVPMDFQATEEVHTKLLKHFQTDTIWDVYKELHIDARVSVGGRYVGPDLPANTDLYGRKYRNIAYDGGVYRECDSHPLADYTTVAEIEANYTWPTADLLDYSCVAKQLEGKEDYPVVGGGSEPFLKYRDLRGAEQAYMDLILYPEIAHYCLDKLFDFCYEDTRRIYEAIPDKVMLTYVAEDLGSQNGLLMSVDHIQEFLLPRMKRIVDVAHSAGAYTIWHSDGSIRDILPEMIKIGQDLLDPVQWRCRGMDREGLKQDFGDKIIFHGAVDNQQTLAFGTQDDVEKEVIYNLDVLGKNGGYILGPCHNIQPVSPVENIVTMYRTGLEHGGL